MSTTRDSLLKAALELSEQERLLLAEQLLETVPDELNLWSVDDPEFLDELDRRANEGSPGIPWEQMRAGLHGQMNS